MKKLIQLLPAFMAVALLFSACSDDDNTIDPYPSELTKGAYVLGYGGFEKLAASITKYDYEADEITEYYYQRQNATAMIGASTQYIYQYDDEVYLTNNAPDFVLVTDPLFVAQDTISTYIIKPRGCVASGDYLYIACWGGNVWSDISLSYLVKYNRITKQVEKKIALEGGPEALEIANGKLYAALNYKNAVAVMDLTTEEFSYIATTEDCYNLLKDKNDNLYVLMSNYSSSDQTGLGYINTTTDALTFYPLENVATSYASLMAFSKDESKIYIVSASGYPAVGGIAEFDTSAKTFGAEPLVTGVSGINGVSVNPEDGNIYVLISNGSSSKGSMQIYNEAGQLQSAKTVGSAPAWTLFLN